MMTKVSAALPNPALVPHGLLLDLHEGDAARRELRGVHDLAHRAEYLAHAARDVEQLRFEMAQLERATAEARVEIAGQELVRLIQRHLGELRFQVGHRPKVFGHLHVELRRALGEFAIRLEPPTPRAVTP
jgi:hypothetical protein